MVAATDYGRPSEPFSNDIPNFLADRPNTFWGIFGQTISTHFNTVSP